MRECADCHRVEQMAVTTGGWCAPANTIYDWPHRPAWICAECRAKYPTPVQYKITCVECEGDGTVEAPHSCEGCDHVCVATDQCEMCRGNGWYMTHDCNPGCDHNAMPLLTVSRGGIKFS